MLCQLCRKPFPEDLVKPALTVQGRPVMTCPVCAVEHCGEFKGMNYRRAVLWLKDEGKRIARAVMQDVALRGL